MSGELQAVCMLNSQLEAHANLSGATFIYIELGMKCLFVSKMCTQLT